MSSGRVGVVVIGRNEGPRLDAALSTARAGAAWVVYVDSGSTDDSVAIAESHDARVVHLDMARPFTAARARNAGVAALRQCAPSLEFVQVMDGDCALIEGWIDAAVAAMDEDTRTVVVCGRRRERFPEESVYNRLCDQEWNTPVGDAESCGGDALLRLSALDSVGGYDATVIAGEEPELCFRLRRKGGRIVRLDRDMTWHDAAMTRFGQWWRRAVRNGHAVAEGAWRHGAGSERFRRKALRSILLWGLLVPLVILAAAWPTWGTSLLASLAYGWLYARVRRYRRGRGDTPADAATYARFCVLGKFPETLGALRFHVNRILGRRPKIIEYKTPAVVERLVAAPAPDAPAAAIAPPSRSPSSSPCVLYVGGMLPCRSETFVYRELLALRERGVHVRAASVHPPERGLGDEVLDALARDALPVYGPGPFRLLADAAGAVARRPWRGAGVVVTIGLDTLFGRDVPFRRRPRVLWQGLAGLALGRRAADTGVAHVHAHMAHVPATIAMYAARYLGATFSFTGHAVDLFCHRTLLRAKLRRAAFAPCISHWHRTFYRTIVDRPDAEFPVVRCGVDPAAFRPGPRLATGAAPRLLAVGRLVPKKGFDVLLRALAMLADEGVSFEARLVGDGPQQEELELLHERLGLGDRVELTGAADNDAVRDAMAAAAFFVLPCRVDRRGDRDGIPVVLMEAMACEACVVSGDLATIRELVQPDETGVLVEPDDPEGLADALRLLMEDPARRRRLARAGRRRVEAEFAIAVNADRLLTALTAVNPRLTPRADAATARHEERAA